MLIEKLVKLGYFQGGGGVNEPEPKKTKYKAEPAQEAKPRFKMPFFRNMDYAGNDDAEVSPGVGWNSMENFKSVKDFLEHKRKKLKGKYVADETLIDDSTVKERKEKMKIRASTLSGLTKQAIDFPLDDRWDKSSEGGAIHGDSETYQTPIDLGSAVGTGAEDGIFPGSVGLGTFETYPSSVPGGMYGGKTPENDFEDKPATALNFGQDYDTEDGTKSFRESGDELNEDDLQRLMNKYLNPAESALFGLPDGMDAPAHDAEETMPGEQNGYYSTQDEGRQMYEDKWNI